MDTGDQGEVMENEAGRLQMADTLLAVHTLQGWLTTPVPDHVHHTLKHDARGLASGLTTLSLHLLGVDENPQRAVDLLDRLAQVMEARLWAEAEMDRKVTEFQFAMDAAEREADLDARIAAGDIQWIGTPDDQNNEETTA